MSPRLLAATVGIGLMTGLDNLLYAYGLAYLPVSTSSILISTQLAFTAGFALLLVRQRFTAFSVNAVVLLSVGAAMLGMNAGGDRPAGVSRAQYSAGFAMTLGAAALYGLVLAVMELSQARHAARAGCAVTYTLVMEMQVVIGFTATAFSAVGMLVNNDFHGMQKENWLLSGEGRTVSKCPTTPALAGSWLILEKMIGSSLKLAQDSHSVDDEEAVKWKITTDVLAKRLKKNRLELVED